MQAPPESFSLSLIGLLFWVDTEIISRSYRFKSLGKFRSAYLDQIRACYPPELFAQLFWQKSVLRPEIHLQSDSIRDRCRALFCPRRFCLIHVGRRNVHARPLNHIVPS